MRRWRRKTTSPPEKDLIDRDLGRWQHAEEKPKHAPLSYAKPPAEEPVGDELIGVPAALSDLWRRRERERQWLRRAVVVAIVAWAIIASASLLNAKDSAVKLNKATATAQHAKATADNGAQAALAASKKAIAASNQALAASRQAVQAKQLASAQAAERRQAILDSCRAQNTRNDVIVGRLKKLLAPQRAKNPAHYRLQLRELTLLLAPKQDCQKLLAEEQAG